MQGERSEAYQPEKYGPTITITRKIYRSGASQYYLAPSGSTVSRGLGPICLNASVQPAHHPSIFPTATTCVASFWPSASEYWSCDISL